MEDSHIAALDFTEDCSLFAVFDGHGGSDVSEFVRRHFLDHLVDNKYFKSKDFATALRQTFLQMDVLLRSDLGKKELCEIRGCPMPGVEAEESMAGCTANVCLIHKNTLYCANAGDSRAVLSRGTKAFELS